MEFIKDIKNPLEKLKALEQLIEQGKGLTEIRKIAGYSKNSNVKEFLVKRGYAVDGERIYKSDTKPKQELAAVTTQVSLMSDIFSIELQNKELQNKELQSNLIALAKQYDEIQKVIMKIKSLDIHMADKEKVITVVQDGIKIDLPNYEGSAYRASIRINPIIWNEFDKFAQEHKEFDKAALIAMAMKEYMTKHNNKD